MNRLASTEFDLDWKIRDYHTLVRSERQDIFQIREAVFIIEQECDYQDIDSLDEKCSHVIGRDNKGVLVAYARILPPGLKGLNTSFGRVLVIKNHRGRKIGRKLVEICIDECRKKYLNSECHISAQTQFIDFYKSFGFKTKGTAYLEDGISHIDMTLLLNPITNKDEIL